MTWQSPSSVTLTIVSIGASLALGCAQPPPETQEATADLAERITVLEQQVAALAIPDDKVIVKVKDGMLAGVVPDPKRICNPARPNCPDQATWILVGTLGDDWSVRLQEKKTSPDQGCFTPPGGLPYFVLTETERQRPSGPAQCDQGAIWEYDVVLMQGDREVDRIDPLFFIPFI